jgi:hypothetical protein
VAGAGESRAQAEDARGTGDGVWVLPRTEHVPSPPRVSFGNLIPLAKQLEVVKQALASFGLPEPADARRRAVERARELLGRTSAGAAAG